MATSSDNHRLAAILAANVVGYSRLMGEDESGTLESLRSHRQELIEPKISEHHVRIVKLMGDGLLAEFPAVEAVQFKSIPNLNHGSGLGDQVKGINKIMGVCRILI
ncbi:MAG: hypothetical protein WBM41_17870 [Arenicellales bacterium]